MNDMGRNFQQDYNSGKILSWRALRAITASSGDDLWLVCVSCDWIYFKAIDQDYSTILIPPYRIIKMLAKHIYANSSRSLWQHTQTSHTP